MNRKYIFVIGGVMSSVGKGVTSASIGKIMQSRGYKVTNIKCDMYINIDAGTIRPTEHGEVFVGDDGIEADQDLGNYERFTGNSMKSENYITTGQVYQEVIRRERNLEYKGEDVEVVPDIPDEIIRRIRAASEKDDAEITIVEFGGTVGEYQVLLFLEAARMMKRMNPEDVAFILVSYLPVPSHIGEMKTKPTQHASRTLNEAGIQADFIVARGPQVLDKPRCDRLSTFCNINDGYAISAPDVETIYEVPLVLEKELFSEKMLRKLNLEPRKHNLDEWREFVGRIKALDEEMNIAIVGKYFGTGDFTLSDSYISVIESIKHAAWAVGRKPKLTWVNSEDFEKNKGSVSSLSKFDGIIVPGGFGERGVEGIISAIQYARENSIPYLGLCYGMQLASIEFARNVAGLAGASTEEVNKNAEHKVIHLNPLQAKNVVEQKYGATMRLGSYACDLVEGTRSREAYGIEQISERHRHRYEFNNDYKKRLKEAGLVFAGVNKEQDLVEIIEIKDHPFFVGVQFHPEFKTLPMSPHPLFLAFAKAAK
jgi:CTP synthase